MSMNWFSLSSIECRRHADIENFLCRGSLLTIPTCKLLPPFSLVIELLRCMS
uniref:Candidate secreted effector n=1 Tax=Meloidogyne incognita TaxID=6306 RepID=A0A914KLH8_MELIC